jgi:hypothetical protein
MSSNYNITGGCCIVNAYCKQSFQLHELAVWQTMLFILYLLVDMFVCLFVTSGPGCTAAIRLIVRPVF